MNHQPIQVTSLVIWQNKSAFQPGKHACSTLEPAFHCQLWVVATVKGRLGSEGVTHDIIANRNTSSCISYGIGENKIFLSHGPSRKPATKITESHNL